MGRPSLYSDELAAKLCEQIAIGRNLTEICRDEGMPDRSTVKYWVVERPDFRERYHAARVWWAHAVAEDIDDLADQSQAVVAAAEAQGRNGSAAAHPLEATAADLWR